MRASLAALTLVVAGSYALDVTINGKSVRDSPFAVQVLPGPTSPSHCVANGRGLIEATAGEPAAFLVTPKDSFGNSRLLDVEDAFSVALGNTMFQNGHLAA